MKILNYIILLIFGVAMVASPQSTTAKHEPIAKDSLMPNPANDHFVILTSDTVLGKENQRYWKTIDADIYRCEAQTVQSAGTKTENIFEIRYLVRLGDDIVFQFDHYQPSPYKKVVLPKAFLQKVKLINFEEKLPRLNDFGKFLHFGDTLTYGKDLRQVKKLRAEAKDKFDIELVSKLKPYQKRIWLIDRRYITADSVTLLEVLAGCCIH